jgi:hypothetical protein
MEWLEPRCSAVQMGEQIALGWQTQLRIEAPPGHALYGIPVKLFAGEMETMHSSNFWMGVSRSECSSHLVQEPGAFAVAGTDIYSSLQEWVDKVMVPEHQEWVS